VADRSGRSTSATWNVAPRLSPASLSNLTLTWPRLAMRAQFAAR
jgi:hypothetical protein